MNREGKNMEAPREASFSAEIRPLWSMKRHVLIAGAAEKLLPSPVKQKIKSILKKNKEDGEELGQTSIREVADWMDAIKFNRLEDDETKAFRNDGRNRKHKPWHYVDLPLGVDGYDRMKYADFTRDDDVVQMLTESIRVLQGNSDRFSDINALRLLVHLVGDIHQPLHVACGYVRKNGNSYKLERDPEIIRQHQIEADGGGNDCILPNNSSMHSYWDGSLGGKLPIEDDPNAASLSVHIDEFAEKIPVESLQPLEAAYTASTLLKLPLRWADESIEAAGKAYDNLTIVGIDAEEKYRMSWISKEAYDDVCAPIAIERARSAAKNLAFILKKLFE